MGKEIIDIKKPHIVAEPIPSEEIQRNNNQKVTALANPKFQIFMTKYFPYIKLFILSQLGVILTVQMTKNLKISNVLSSSVQGLLFVSLLEQNFDCHYSATFAGMSSIAVFHDNMWYACFTAFIHTLLFLATKKIFVGFGGKLGTIAMISCLIGAILTEIVLGDDYVYPIHEKELYEAEDFQENYYLNPIFCCIGSVLCYVIKKYTKVNNNAVIASCLVGVLGSFIVPMVHDEKTAKIEVLLYVGAFVGMGTEKILDGFIGYTIAGILSGFILQGLNGTFLVGGKYGFSAFLAVCIYYFAKVLVQKVIKKRKQQDSINNNNNEKEIQIQDKQPTENNDNNNVASPIKAQENGLLSPVQNNKIVTNFNSEDIVLNTETANLNKA